MNKTIIAAAIAASIAAIVIGIWYKSRAIDIYLPVCTDKSHKAEIETNDKKMRIMARFGTIDGRVDPIILNKGRVVLSCDGNNQWKVTDGQWE